MAKMRKGEPLLEALVGYPQFNYVRLKHEGSHGVPNSALTMELQVRSRNKRINPNLHQKLLDDCKSAQILQKCLSLDREWILVSCL